MPAKSDTHVPINAHSMKPGHKASRRLAISLPLLLLTGLAALLLTQCQEEGPATSGKPKLVLQITVDGLRGDLLDRYSSRLGEGGFKRIMRNGAVFTNAHYEHGNTETIVGHTTLATGAQPAVHGMIGNAWYDPKTDQLAYNIEDADHPMLAPREKASEAAEVDPSKKAIKTDGRSPKNILAPTFSDSLAIATGGKAKMIAICSKDRGAVSMAGKSGTAYWFSTDYADFVTSSYYKEEYPTWVAEWNAERKADAYADTDWALQHPLESYLHGERDNRSYEVDLKGFGRTFPHKFAKKGHPLFTTQLLVSPAGDDLTADFAIAALSGEGIGKDDVTDYLSVSFSGVDAVQHFFGPGSLEAEVTLRRLDQSLERLLKAIDREVGLSNTLIVLSADHGMPEMPEFATESGHPAGRITPESVVNAALAVGKEHGVEQVVKYFFRPYLYLDHQAIAAASADPDEITRDICEAITDLQGIHLAVSSDAPLDPSKPNIAKIRNNHCEGRSGDIYVYQDPYWFLFDKGPVACMHGSPWNYDTHVPVVFSGPGVKRGTFHDRVAPADVAPTLSQLLGIPAPAAASGEPLIDAVK